MKALIIFLLMASVAWAGDLPNFLDCYHGVICYDEGQCVCADNIIEPTYTMICPKGFIKEKGECKPMKGHCPICGAKGEVLFKIVILDRILKLFYGCPNGHVFWEKEVE